MELANVTVEDVTGLHAIQNKGDAYEHAHQDQDVLSAVPEYGSDQGYETVSHIQPERNEKRPVCAE